MGDRQAEQISHKSIKSATVAVRKWTSREGRYVFRRSGRSGNARRKVQGNGLRHEFAPNPQGHLHARGIRAAFCRVGAQRRTEETEKWSVNQCFSVGSGLDHRSFQWQPSRLLKQCFPISHSTHSQSHGGAGGIFCSSGFLIVIYGIIPSFGRGRKDSDLRDVREHVSPDYKSGTLNHSVTAPFSTAQNFVGLTSEFKPANNHSGLDPSVSTTRSCGGTELRSVPSHLFSQIYRGESKAKPPHRLWIKKRPVEILWKTKISLSASTRNNSPRWWGKCLRASQYCLET